MAQRPNALGLAACYYECQSTPVPLTDVHLQSASIRFRLSASFSPTVRPFSSAASLPRRNGAPYIVSGKIRRGFYRARLYASML